MNLLKRIFLFLAVNMAIVILISLVTSLLGIDTLYLKPNGIDLSALAVFCLIWGTAGSFISLLLSKRMAKWTVKIRTIQSPATVEEKVIWKVVQQISQQAGIKMPEVGIYESSEVNAFATGASKNNSLVAVSSGLLEQMTHEEIEGVVAHEMAHIINGDMVTLTLIQGVVNAFVMFFARIVAYAIQNIIKSDSDGLNHFSYMMTTIAFELVFGFFGMMIVSYFSRTREFAADKGSAQYVGRQKMIAALVRLEALQNNIQLHKGLATFKISDKPSRFGQLLATHPPLKKRIEALQRGN